ncbi:MAG: gamma carbonic anhydrase family protein [Desulfobacteraceae bacterium]|jgi:carbonic anhydrase/acetyltransferase-like protein (isoleucine patch superfamily)
MIISYRGQRPKIGKNVYIAPTAVVIGNVHLQDNVSIWFNTVLRGDKDAIYIGENSNIQDNTTIHVDPGAPVNIGNNVTVGHNAMVHGCTIENGALIGINAVVLNHSIIGEGSIVAAGSVVTQGQKIVPYRLAVGIPAKEKKELNPADWSQYNAPVASYLRLKDEYMLENTFLEQEE